MTDDTTPLAEEISAWLTGQAPESILTHLLCPAFLTNQERKLLWANGSAEHFFQAFPAHEDFSSCFTPETREPLLDCQKIRQDRKFRVKLTLTNLELMPNIWDCIFCDVPGQPSWWLCLLHPISNHEISHPETSHRQKLERAFFSSSLPAVLCDSQLQITTVNQGLLELFQAQADQFLGKTPQFLFKQKELWPSLEAELRANGVWHGEMEMVRGFESFFVQLTWTLVYGEFGMIQGALGSFKEITQAKLERDDLRQSEEKFTKAFDGSPAMLAICSLADGRVVDVNNSFLRASGHDRYEILGRNFREVRFWADHEDFLDILRAAREADQVHEREIAMRTRSGEQRILMLSAQRMRLGHKPCLLLAATDITELKNTHRALEDSEKRFRAMLTHAPEALLLLDWDTGFFIEVNARAEQLFGLSRENLLKTGFYRLCSPIQPNGQDAKVQGDAHLRRASQGESLEFEWLFLGLGGEKIPCLVQLAPLPASERILIRLSISDLRSHKRTASQMIKLSRALDQTADAVMITDRDGIIEYINPAFELMTGYSREDIVGKSPAVIKSDRHDVNFFQKMWETILSGGIYREILINRRKTGVIYYEEKTITPLKDQNGEITHFISTGKDITERMATQERLEYLAFHDVLTELPNRTLFLERLTAAIHKAERQDSIIAVLFMDVDRFKLINDTLGHDIGDQLLKQISLRMVKNVRRSDTVARFGGDEFAIMLEDLHTPDDILPITRKIIASFSQPFNLGDSDLYTTASLGVSLFPGDGTDPGTLLKNADSAMYRAKERGRNNFQFYTTDLGTLALARFTMESSLRGALDRDEFELYYQPQVSLQSGNVEGMEALIRWRHPQRGMISPVEFIPLLEETGLIIEVGRWVIERACLQARQWIDAGLPPLRLSVNLSGKQFYDPHLMEIIFHALRQTSLPASLLEIELTESTLMEQAHFAMETLAKLREIGVRFAVDDFGTGYSSLSYLKRFPLDTLKIDRSFVNELTRDSDDATIVTTIVAMANSLKLDVVAEGVETIEQLDFLKKIDCRLMQGYYYSPPLPADDFQKLVESGRGI